MEDEDRLLARAFAAYFRSAARNGVPSPNQPANDSYVIDLDGKGYVVLRNASGTLAVYRIRTSGVLKELKRWPRDVAPARGEPF
jgi:hypothetical protein